VFSSPSANQVLNATRSAHGGAGVLYLYGNYAGDTMNFDLAAELAAEEGIQVSTVRVADDVASAPASEANRRRGVAAQILADRILEELKLQPQDRVAVLVNGLGATPKEELYLVYRRIHMILSERSVQIHSQFIGEYATSLEMAGASVTLLYLDDELMPLLDAPAVSPLLVSRVGRASWLQERSRDHADPGATACAMAFSFAAKVTDRMISTL
jgi:dihydroxyacetone kinase